MIWVLLIIAVVALGYFYSSSSNTQQTSISSTDSSDAEVGAQVLALLNQIQSLNIDSSIFKDPGFNTLVDYSVEIPPVDVGRPNPFAPLPGYSAAQAPAVRPSH